MNNRDEHIREMVDRFFTGDTGCDEEKMLYDYFAGGDVAPELVRYKPVFGYFENMGGDELPVDPPVRERKRLKWYQVAGPGVAACFLLALTLFGIRGVVREHDPFAGSYMIVDGVKITDPAVVYPEARATLKLEHEIMSQIDEMLGLANFIESEVAFVFEQKNKP